MMCTALLLLSINVSMVLASTLPDLEQLGEKMYQDTHFSLNGTQSCKTCHHHVSGFADPANSRDPYYTVVSLGDDRVSLGGCNAPTAAYAGYSPVLQQDDYGVYFGGMFWDGRATGWTLGDPLAEQAQGPPLNPVEMNMPDKDAVVQAVRDSLYVQLFLKVFGENALDDIDSAFDDIGRAIAAYERSSEVQELSSCFDQENLNDQERRGLHLFGDNCTQYHSMKDVTEKGPLFTDHTYYNIGVSVNHLLADNAFDLGLTDLQINDIVSFLMALTDL